MPPDYEPTVDQKIQKALHDHNLAQRQLLHEQTEEFKKLFNNAFPDGDPAGHKAYHEAQIEFMKERTLLWREIRSKTLAGLAWMLLLAIGTALIDQAKTYLGR